MLTRQGAHGENRDVLISYRIERRYVLRRTRKQPTRVAQINRTQLRANESPKTTSAERFVHHLDVLGH